MSDFKLFQPVTVWDIETEEKRSAYFLYEYVGADYPFLVLFESDDSFSEVYYTDIAKHCIATLL